MGTQREAELWLGIDERHVREVEHRVSGMKDARKRGDWQTYCRLAIAFYREVKAGRLEPTGGDDDRLDLNEQKALLARAQREAHELKNAVTRGELLRVADVEATWTGIVLTIKERLRSLPARAVQHIPGFRKAMAKRLAEMVDEVLTELAHDGKPVAPALDADAADRRDVAREGAREAPSPA